MLSLVTVLVLLASGIVLVSLAVSEPDDSDTEDKDDPSS